MSRENYTGADDQNGVRMEEALPEYPFDTDRGLQIKFEGIKALREAVFETKGNGRPLLHKILLDHGSSVYVLRGCDMIVNPLKGEELDDAIRLEVASKINGVISVSEIVCK